MSGCSAQDQYLRLFIVLLGALLETSPSKFLKLPQDIIGARLLMMVKITENTLKSKFVLQAISRWL